MDKFESWSWNNILPQANSNNKNLPSDKNPYAEKADFRKKISTILENCNLGDLKSLEYESWPLLSFEENPTYFICTFLNGRTVVGWYENSELIKEPKNNYLISTASNNNNLISTASNDIDIKTDPFSFSSGDGKMWLRFEPSADEFNTNLHFTEDYFKAEIELNTAINSMSDTRIKWQLFMFLDAARQYWMYIWLEKWKNFENFSLSWVMKLEWWSIKISAWFLNKMMEFDFSEFDKSFDPQVNQRSYGIDYTREVNDGVLKALKASLTCNKSKNINFWVLWNNKNENADYYELTDIFWWARGWTVTTASVEADIKLGETLKVSSSFWAQQSKFNSIWNVGGESSLNVVWWIWIIYQPNSYNQLSANFSSSWKTYSTSVRYSHQFKNWWIEWFFEASRDNWSNTASVWLNIPLGWNKRTQYWSLFDNIIPKEKLNFWDLIPNNRVTSEQVQIKSVTWENTRIEMKPQWWEENIHPEPTPEIILGTEIKITPVDLSYQEIRPIVAQNWWQEFTSYKNEHWEPEMVFLAVPVKEEIIHGKKTIVIDITLWINEKNWYHSIKSHNIQHIDGAYYLNVTYDTIYDPIEKTKSIKIPTDKILWPLDTTSIRFQNVIIPKSYFTPWKVPWNSPEEEQVTKKLWWNKDFTSPTTAFENNMRASAWWRELSEEDLKYKYKNYIQLDPKSQIAQYYKNTWEFSMSNGIEVYFQARMAQNPKTGTGFWLDAWSILDLVISVEKWAKNIKTNTSIITPSNARSVQYKIDISYELNGVTKQEQLKFVADIPVQIKNWPWKNNTIQEYGVALWNLDIRVKK